MSHRSQTTRDPNLLEALACQLCDQTFEHEEEFQNHRAGHENIEVKLEFEKSLKARGMLIKFSTFFSHVRKNGYPS